METTPRWIVACRDGDLQPCGWLQPEDRPAEAIPVFTSACDRGDASGCSGLGSMYEQGVHVTRDPRRAFELKEKACKLSDAACCRLGCYYQRGFGTQRDAAKADKLMAKCLSYEKSCETLRVE
jgi:TPR repeat protein